jgi:hypothetical protein
VASSRHWTTKARRKRQTHRQTIAERSLAWREWAAEGKMAHSDLCSQVVIDSLLPKAEDTGAPLHSITRRLPTSLAAPSPSASYPLPSSGIEVGPAWIPLILKGYFKAHGGYSLRGSNPAPDIYSLTGWIPERLNLRDDFQREKEWSRLYTAWRKGEVLVTLGTGPRSKTKRTSTDRELIPLHAFAVLGQCLFVSLGCRS